MGRQGKSGRAGERGGTGVRGLPGLLLLGVLALGCAGRAGRAVLPALGQQAEVAPGLLVTRLTEEAYVVTHLEPWPANALLVEMGDGRLVLVNTTHHAQAAAALLRWVEEHFGARQLVAINTHFHLESVGGNAALRAAGVPVYGSDLTVKALGERGERMRQEWLYKLQGSAPLQALFQQAPLVPPDRVFPARQGLTLDFAGEPVRVFYPGAAHSPDNVVVHFPRRGILFGGPLVLGGPGVGNTADADLAAWADALERLAHLEATWVIPGHGQRFGSGLVQHTRQVLAPHLEGGGALRAAHAGF